MLNERISNAQIVQHSSKAEDITYGCIENERRQEYVIGFGMETYFQSHRI